MLLTPILLSLAVTLACGRPVEKLHWSGEFDYYTFTQEYPPGECYSYSAKEQGGGCFYPSNSSCWTIHGLWPTKNGSKNKPSYCDGYPHKKVCKHTGDTDIFNPKVIESLVPQLVANWTNLKPSTWLYSFWCHEYVRHGTCTEMGEYSFFDKGLKLLYQVGVWKVLSRGGIVPSNRNTYDADEVQRVLTSYHNASPVLQCETVNESTVLTQIEICLTKDFLPMDCPNSEKKNTCFGEVLYPESQYSTTDCYN